MLNFSTDSSLNATVEYPTGSFEADFGLARLYEPYRFCVPKFEFITENRFVIHQMEYTFHQNIMPQWIIGLWLHAWDGNTITRLSPDGYRRIPVTLTATP